MLGRLLNRGLNSIDLSSSPTKEENRDRRGVGPGTGLQSTSSTQPKLTSPPIPTTTTTTTTTTAELSPDVPAVVNNEDSYARTILYGTPNHFQDVSLLPQNFRLVVVLEKNDLMQKNNYCLLYDSSKDAYPNYQHYHNHQFRSSQQAPANAAANDIRHQLNVLTDLMFGNGLYCNDLNLSDTEKLHVLPKLPLLRSSILITKSFFVKVDKRESRISIGLVIPIGLDLLSTLIYPNWNTITFLLTHMKASFIENHFNKQLFTIINNTNFMDLSRIFKILIKSLHNLNNIPRLLPGLNKFDSMLYNWCFEVNNWIEMKDGGKFSFNSGSKFLSVLLTAISVVKHQLVYDELSDKTECTRVIVVASNPGVAQKLIFLISELLPFNLDYQMEASDSASSATTTTASTTTTTAFPNKPLQNNENSPINCGISYGNNSEATLTSSSTDSYLKESTPAAPSFTKKGWEIPISASKSMNSTSIEIAHSSSVKSTQLSTSNSMAYLSSSLSNSQSSMIPSSLTRGFQLLQNWKNSTDSPSSSLSSPTLSNHSLPSPSNSSNLEYDDYPWTPSTTSNPTPVITPLNPNSLNGSQFNDRYMRTSFHNHHRPSVSSISRNNSFFDLSNISASAKIKKINIPKLPHIDRNSSTLYNIGENNTSYSGRNQQYNKLRVECANLMNCKKIISSVETDDTKDVSVLDIPIDYDEDGIEDLDEDDSDSSTQSTTFTTLPLTCSYINEYAPEFQLQACPPQADLENRILNSMKLDVTYGPYKSCNTLIISLRTREIRQLCLKKNNNNNNNNNYNGTESNVFVKNKKLYSNSKVNWSMTPKENFQRVDSLIEEILQIFQTQQVIHKGVDFEDLEDEIRFKPFIKIRELLMSL